MILVKKRSRESCTWKKRRELHHSTLSIQLYSSSESNSRYYWACRRVAWIQKPSVIEGMVESMVCIYLSDPQFNADRENCYNVGCFYVIS